MNAELKEYLDFRFERLEQTILIAAQINAKPVIGVDEAAELTGYLPEEILQLAKSKEIPHYKRGSKIYFKREEVFAWMTENKVI